MTVRIDGTHLKIEDVVNVGDKLRVKIVNIDDRGKIDLIRPELEGKVAPRTPRTGGGDRGPRRDDRGRDDRGPRRDDRSRDDRGERADRPPRDREQVQWRSAEPPFPDRVPPAPAAPKEGGEE